MSTKVNIILAARLVRLMGAAVAVYMARRIEPPTNNSSIGLLMPMTIYSGAT